MGFDLTVKNRALLRAKYRCEACGRHWYDLKAEFGDTPLRGHSGSTLHIVENKQGLYVATSVPDSHWVLKGKPMAKDAFIVQRLNRGDDAFCLCPTCHAEVHRIAFNLSREKLSRMTDSKNAIPFVLEEVTIGFILGRGKWMY